MVEPIAGLLGALFVSYCRPFLPFSMSLAAGAMIFVVADSLIPEMHAHGNRALATQGLMIGFATMMVLDVALG
jgi:ZIP family zinc transporter